MARRRYKGDPVAEPGDKPAVSTKEQQVARRWKRELTLAGKREKDWRKEGEKIYKRYRAGEKKYSRYNVLWSNTDVLRPAIYNSKPDPDVRRRFRDSDPLGKAVGEVLERSLYVMCDGDSTDDALKLDVLDSLLPGRGVSRVVYVPKLAPAGDTNPKPAPDEAESVEDPDDTGDEDAGGGSEPVEPGEGDYEQVEDEQVDLQHVDWKDFRHGYGRTWPEVPWVGFRHELDRKDAVKKFGRDVLVGLTFSAQQQAEEGSKKYSEEAASVAKVAEFWEIWDKESGTVFFLQETLEQRLFPIDNPDGAPPLELEGFFPCPRPLLLVEDAESLIPTPIFRLYECEAEQLDILSARIDRIIKALRLRGVYDSRLAELADLMKGEDNDLTPIQNAQQWADVGGLDKAIYWMPIEQAVKVLEALYESRQRQKAIIDELTGIADIVRGVTDPDETLGAQQMKGGYFSVRLWRYQQEVKRYGRDLIRLASQVMASKFGADTFARMTDLNFPTNAQHALMQQRLQLFQQQAAQMPPPQPGQPPPPPPQPPFDPALLQMPTWEQILQMMRSPALRQFRIDVETDSMIAGTIQADMAGLAQVLQAIAETMQGLAPLVQSGSLPIDAAKELVMTVIRRARMGTAVEDAFDKMTAPKPPPDPNAGKAQAAAAAAQAKGQVDVQVAKERGQVDIAIANAQQAAQERQNQQEQAMEAQRQAFDQRMRVWEDRLDSFTKIITAAITATKQPDSAVQPGADAFVSAGPPQ